MARLILFTRYPVPGRVKTRMIPVLGAEGSCSLHRSLVEHTILQINKLMVRYDLTFEVRYSGGNRTLMQKWLGEGREFSPQGRGSLGSRMKRAFDQAFRTGFTRVILIGSDIPGLNAEILRKAFSALSFHDLVLGPAGDGGYYLIGMTQCFPFLFDGIPWGESAVLEKTLDHARQSALKIDLLEKLDDIDRPSDLPVWEKLKILE
ncbi:MAG TPA: TIGR04282 family arsenosugar biosynthesis glycosyltransferase [Thermodesulfobacteriota bacterium]|nr:TIGR04282 family arsenosugar biosynthesis glycosyltransferase [Thermodesulfobacteriota bacterium]